jgi:hypothetical protein
MASTRSRVAGALSRRACRTPSGFLKVQKTAAREWALLRFPAVGPTQASAASIANRQAKKIPVSGCSGTATSAASHACVLSLIL